MADYWNSAAPATDGGLEQSLKDNIVAAYLTPESPMLSDFGDSPCINPSDLFASSNGSYDSYLTSPADSYLTSPTWGHDSGIDLNLWATAGASPDVLGLSPTPAVKKEERTTPTHKKRGSTSSIGAVNARKRRIGRNTATAPEDPEDRKAWQKHKNTLAARKSRNRKRHEVDQLTETVKQLREALAARGYKGPLMSNLAELEDNEDEDEDEE